MGLQGLVKPNRLLSSPGTMHETYDAEIVEYRGAATAARGVGLRLGVVGGGQLAKMTAMAGLQLGCDVVVLERNNYSPAANLASHSVVGDWDDPEALLRLASMVDTVTLENEFVDAGALATLEECGHPVYPTPTTLRLSQDKFIQKKTVAAAGVSVPGFREIADRSEILEAAAEYGWPLVLKARRNGYDGKGNATLRGDGDIATAWARLGGGTAPLYVEAYCPFVKELATIITRGLNGATATYPLVESIQEDHICHVVKAPARVSPEIERRALDMAMRAVTAVGGIGSFGVEMFLLEDGDVAFNELAPRVHNSGHYTIEACACSQFENHVRAVMGWPLGSTRLLAPAAAMVNLLGHARGAGRPAGLERALAVPGAHVHIYGKAMAGAGRKMGHVTALGDSIEEALAMAQDAAAMIRFGGKP